MEQPFVWYDFNNSQIIDLPYAKEIEYEWDDEEMTRWRFRVFQAVSIPTVNDGLSIDQIRAEYDE